MEENITNVAEVATEAAVVSTNSGKKSGLVIGIATIVTVGVAFGTYKLISKICKKKAAKKAAATAE